MKLSVLHSLRFASLVFAACLAIPAVAQAPMQRNQADMVVTPAARDQVIDQLVKVLQDSYVFPDQGRLMEKALRAKQSAGAYRDINSAAKLAEVLTGDIRSVNKDQHLISDGLLQRTTDS
jgi:hypothetical protein